MIGLGVRTNKINLSSGYDPVSQAFFTAAGITNDTQKQAVDFEYKTLKAAGISTGVALYPIVGGASTPHSYNLFNTSTKQLTYAGTITHDGNGMQGNGVNGTANTSINPSTDLNGDFAMWHYSRTAITSGGNRCDAGVIAGGANPGVYMGFQTHTNSGIAANCDINTSLGLVANTSGFFLMKRVGNTVTIKRNDVTIHTFTAPNTSYQNGLIRLMASVVLPSSTVNFSGKQYTDFGFVKTTFTAGMDTAAYNAVLGKETILGRNV